MTLNGPGQTHYRVGVNW